MSPALTSGVFLQGSAQKATVPGNGQLGCRAEVIREPLPRCLHQVGSFGYYGQKVSLQVWIEDAQRGALVHQVSRHRNDGMPVSPDIGQTGRGFGRGRCIAYAQQLLPMLQEYLVGPGIGQQRPNWLRLDSRSGQQIARQR